MSNNRFGFDNIKKEAENLMKNAQAQNFIQGANSNNNENANKIAKKIKNNTKTEDEKIAQIKETDEKFSNSALNNKKNAKKNEQKIKLVIEGQLTDRHQTSKAMHLYIKNEYLEWIKNNTAAGRGGQQMIINYLIAKGIEKTETEYKNKGLIFSTESE